MRMQRPPLTRAANLSTSAAQAASHVAYKLVTS